MIEIKNIVKNYIAGDSVVNALKDVSINFRENEFVSILGPSGCGKTTLLNVMGGLDRYDSGEIIINGKSTKEFKDADWDAYRNHYIGFIFQNYNLIPHLSVLENVEIALSIAGLNRKEKKHKAKDALARVGLGDQIHKKPNQLSGGQMQRVAIARAIVNNPKIILADEPTGALDSETSVQIMDLLKEIAGDHLIVMVTHNQELADTYSTRIISLLDGKVTNDTNPFVIKPVQVQPRPVQPVQGQVVQQAQQRPVQPNAPRPVQGQVPAGGAVNRPVQPVQGQVVQQSQQRPVQPNAPVNQNTNVAPRPVQTVQPNTPVNNTQVKTNADKQNKPKSAMGLFTAILLSFKNLLTKKGRTFMTSFAGSIGIIGIALVLAVSNGFSGYVNNVQSDALGNHPIAVSAFTIDFQRSMQQISSGLDEEQEKVEEDVVVPYDPKNKFAEFGHLNNLNTKFIDAVEKFVEEDSKKAEPGLNLVDYNYYVPLRLVRHDADGTYNYVYKPNTISGLSGDASTGMYTILEDLDFVKTQYDLVYGDWPTKSEEYDYSDGMLLVLNEDNKVSSSTLSYYLGLKLTKDDEGTFHSVPFDQLCNKEFKIIFNNDYYLPQDAEGNSVATDNLDNIEQFGKVDIEDQAVLQQLYTQSEHTLKISGVIKLKENASAVLLNSGFVYMRDFYDFYRQNCIDSLIGKKARENKDGSNKLYDAYEINVSESDSIVPSFESVGAINKFLKDNLNYTIPLNDAYEFALQQLGISKVPVSIKFYSKDFETKDEIIKFIENYNAQANTKADEIVYSDTSTFLTSTLGSLIQMISYVLVAFAGISLVVSSIMISIITYVSVIERTKEIGVLRSIGARKKDITRVFNAETFLIGLCAGLLGVLISWLLCFPISAIIQAVAGGAITQQIAILDPIVAVVLVVISILLTLVAGFVPSKIAANKDPVKALRSE